MLEGTNEMRFATMANMFRAARYPLKIWNREQAGIEDVTKVGLKGSPTVVSKVFAPHPACGQGRDHRMRKQRSHAI